MARIQRAIVSVTDKTGVVEFARQLATLGVELLSTGGTARQLQSAGIAVREIGDWTGFPEMFDGRVKTLHPKVHGGILQVRGNESHRSAADRYGIAPIDMVVVNLYAFEQAAAKPATPLEELIENIDIGGPALIRSAAKNFRDVAVLTSPADYDDVAAELVRNQGELSLATRWRLAQRAFAATAAYDAAIASTLEAITLAPAATGPDPASPNPSSVPGGGGAAAREGVAGETFEFRRAASDAWPATLRLRCKQTLQLRYGENPHQRAAVYSDGSGVGVANGRQLQGKELSYNNLVDLQAAWDLAADFEEPFCAIIKHTNPCGSATGTDSIDAFLRAFACDPVSAFGGVIALNRPVDGATAEAIAGLRYNNAGLFIECIAAPAFAETARQRFSKRKDLRLLEVIPGSQNYQIRAISGGLLLQTPDSIAFNPRDLKLVTRRAPSDREMKDLQFAWKVCKHIKSNAILYARDGQGIGVGAGQLSRVDAAKVGAMKAVLPLQGAVAASDAYFPFPDGVEEIARAGATAVIQPGGSIRDPEVIEAADRLGLAMVFTGVRHFRH
jgi:phosphoribosylaminoimidazolecarboxamide formyltransferase/IMP cyclohydrolase